MCPNNAVIVVAGDIDVPATKKMIADYFGDIPRGAEVPRVNVEEKPIEAPIKAVAYDPNIQIPAVVTGYRMPAVTTREAKVLDMISTYLSDGNSSKLYKKMVDEQKMALQVGAFNISQEDYGMYLIFGLPLGDNSLESLVEAMDEEVVKIQNELISAKDFQKLQNKFETDFVNANASVEGIANSLAEYYTFYGDTNRINSEIEVYRSISPRRNSGSGQKIFK